MSRMSVAEVRAVAQQRRAAIVDIPVEQPKPASRLRSRFLPGSAPAEARPGASAPPRAEGDIAALESVLKACAAFRRKIGLIHGAIGAVLGTVIGFAIGLDAILALGFAVLGFLIGYALAGQLSKRPAPARKPQKLANRRGARLFALIEQTARRLEMQAPKTILLTDGAYIWLPPTQKPGRAALEIGLPLLESLSVPALSALIARAFHRSREVARSPFRHVFTEIAAIESMAAKLSARSPALALGMAPKAAELADSLRRAATPILRGIDRGADSIAISAVGTGELADAIVAQTVLRHQFSAQDGLDLEEQLIAIRSGIADEDVDAAIRMALTRPETDAGYSHQPLRERLQRLDPKHQPAPIPQEPTASEELLDDDLIAFARIMDKKKAAKPKKDKAPKKERRRRGQKGVETTPSLAPDLGDLLSDADERAARHPARAIDIYGELVNANPAWDTARLRLALALLEAGDTRGIAVGKQVCDRQPAAIAIVAEAIEALLDSDAAQDLDVLAEKRALLGYKELADKAAEERTSFAAEELQPAMLDAHEAETLAGLLGQFPEITAGYLFSSPVSIMPERAHAVLILHAPSLSRPRAAEVGGWLAERIVATPTIAVHIECGRMNAALEPLVASSQPVYWT